MNLSRVATSIIAGFLCVLPVAHAIDIETVTFTSAGRLSMESSRQETKLPGEMSSAVPGDELKAYLAKPQGNGPFPAIVVMHGCGGLSERFKQVMMERLVSWGYVTLVIDSFANHEVKNGCGEHRARSRRDLRPFDAVGGLQYLSTRPFVASNRIGLLGYSQGAWAALYVAQARSSPIFQNSSNRKYRAVVAFYPECSSYFDVVEIPTLVLIGENDEWTPAHQCIDMMKRRGEKGALLDLQVYPGAHHGFDWIDFRPGRKVDGHHLEYDPKAFEHSLEKHREFFKQKLGG